MIGIPDAALFNAGMAALAAVIEAENLHAAETSCCVDKTCMARQRFGQFAHRAWSTGCTDRLWKHRRNKKSHRERETATHPCGGCGKCSPDAGV